MSYQVLARKWRPRTFRELIGQEHVVKALTNALAQQRLHHAYLFTGTRGVGKTTLARILAKALNCEAGISPDPCGTCAACSGIDIGRYVDLMEVDAASNTKVDQMRDLLENAQYAPTAGRFKVFIIDEVHMLSSSSFNAMLKTLEEPPAHVKFILATTDPQKMPVTVLSRCLQFNLRQMPAPAIAGHLQSVLEKEHIQAEHTALQLLARSAAGSMRDALSLLDQAIAFGGGNVSETDVRTMLGAIDQSYLFNLLDALARRDGPALLEIAGNMDQRSLSFDAALSDLAMLLHQVALAQAVPEALAQSLPERPRLVALANLFSAEDLQLFYQIALLGRRDLGLAPDEYAGFTMCLLRMLAFAPADALPGALPASPVPARQTSPSTPVHPSPEEAEVAPIIPMRTAEAFREQPQRMEPASGEQPGPAALTAFDGDWRGLVERLKLGGMARMLAQNCELAGFDGKHLKLTVPQSQKHLTDNAYQEKLRGSLREHFGKQLQVQISLGGEAANTPAQLIGQEKAARQADAESAIQADPFVKDLIDSFGASIVPASIKPIQQ